MKTKKNNNAKQASCYSQRATKDHAKNILKVWKANREFRLHDISFEDYEKMHDDLDRIMKKGEALKREFHELRIAKEKLSARLGLMNTRARNGMSGYFGPQSPEFASIRVCMVYRKPVRKASKPVPAEPDATGPVVPWKFRTVRKRAGEKFATPPTPPPAVPAPAPVPEPVAV